MSLAYEIETAGTGSEVRQAPDEVFIFSGSEFSAPKTLQSQFMNSMSFADTAHTSPVWTTPDRTRTASTRLPLEQEKAPILNVIVTAPPSEDHHKSFIVAVGMHA